jgi:gamma-glutamylcysteine synthetase
LNGLAVNLEVVRSRLAKGISSEADVASFTGNAVVESEQLASLVDGVVALLELTVGAVDESGKFRCSITGDSTITLEAAHETINRAAPRLESLADAAGFRVETGETAVILTFPPVPPED